MCPVKIRILTDHLRFKPQAELHSHLMHPVRELPHAASELAFIDHPVAQTRTVIIPFAEPSIVQYQHFHAHLPGSTGKIQDLLRVKIKIGCFPAVDQNRPGLPPVGGNHLLAENIMILTAQAVQALCTE